ncbi:MAG: DUF1501 domain-containing protein [Acidobacteria bacterium]|nr:DUF1501 domain-containing protein [Acidobacteriota bacterium]MBV9068733.1 DUF1501 domain-containing protein [Acidobacteriota bacterium]MBV9188082.1 DUF1501 domain-containing protein [Acidobacteriota bacterium]
MIDRRFFLKSSGLALVGGTLLPNVFVRMANAATTKGNKTLVAIFQRGAVDGLNMIVPYGEQAYYAARPTIAVPRPGAEGGAIDLDGFFGLHPSLASLSPYFKDHSLAMIHAVGSPDTTRSHFDAQDFMESGTPGVKSTEDGFLARAVGTKKESAVSPLRAVALSPAMPRILSGGAGAVAMTNISQFGIRGGANVSGGFESMYAEAVAGTLGGTAKESFEAARILKSADRQKLQPENGAVYPNGPLGNSLRQIAQLIKSNVGLEVAFADVSGWDTHAGEGGAQGQLANNLRNFSDAIAAFARDLGSRMGDVVLVTMSEFGRTVHENGNRGTDHGHANVMLLLGGGVKGGKVHGKWPGLGSQQLYENRDLAITTDFRDIFAELLTKQLAVPSLKSVFPNYEPKLRGVMLSS